MEQGTEVVSVCTTVSGEDSARKLARNIVESRLAACVQSVPIRSTYRWKGSLEESDEFLLTAKTRHALAEPLSRFIREHHAYEVPEILVQPVCGGSRAYLDWVLAETAAPQ